jgi:hypothetical protein
MQPDPENPLSLTPEGTSQVTLKRVVHIRLFDRQARPMPGGVAFKIVLGGRTVRGTTESDGAAIADARPEDPSTCTVSWGAVTADGDGNPLEDTFEYAREVRLDADADESDEGLRARLSHLGYSPEAPLDACVRAFQRDHGLVSADDQPGAGDPAHPATRTALLDTHLRMKPRPRLLPRQDDPAIDGDEGGAASDPGASQIA